MANHAKRSVLSITVEVKMQAGRCHAAAVATRFAGTNDESAVTESRNVNFNNVARVDISSLVKGIIDSIGGGSAARLATTDAISKTTAKKLPVLVADGKRRKRRSLPVIGGTRYRLDGTPAKKPGRKPMLATGKAIKVKADGTPDLRTLRHKKITGSDGNNGASASPVLPSGKKAKKVKSKNVKAAKLEAGEE